MNIKIKVFRADLEPELCERYVDGHRKVLEAYGVSQVTSANVDWMKEPYSYVIVVDAVEDGRILGGARIQLASGTTPLPIETAIDDLDPRIYDFVREKAKYRTAEFCGAWNSKEVAGYGVGSVFLGRVCSSVLVELQLGSIFAFASPVSLRLCKRVGFKVIEELGNKGTFYYPKEDLIATALIIDDPVELTGAREEDRNRILELREEKIQSAVEHGPKGEVHVEYDLSIDKNIIIKSPLELNLD